MWPTANTFRAGHRIRLQVSSGAHPLFNRNAGTGEPLASGANLRSADQEVFHDARRPSSISLHVVPLLLVGRRPCVEPAWNRSRRPPRLISRA